MPVRYFGRDDADFSRLVPVLARLVSQTPQVITALYLSLEPGVELALHRGNPIGVARCHLGLVVPEGCAIEVAGEQRTWQEGEWLVFDDSVEHRAWNRSERTRIVLSLDLEHPDVPVDRTIRMMRVLTRTYYVTMKRVPRSLQGKLSPVGRTISRIVRRLQGERQR